MSHRKAAFTTMPSTIEYSERPSDTMKRVIRAAQAGVNAAAEQWATQIMPRHFEPEAAQKYGYTPRQGEGEPAWVYSKTGTGKQVKSGRIVRNNAYWWQKRRMGFGTTSLVKTGESKRQATTGATIRKETVGEGTVRSVVRIPVPAYFFMWRERKTGGHVDKVAELTRILPSESDALQQVVRDSVDQMMSRFNSPGMRQIVRAA